MLEPFVAEDFFLNDENEEVDDDEIISFDADVLEDKDADMNITQLLMQEGTLRQVDDVFAAIKSECEECGQQLIQHIHAILILILADIYKIRI